MSSTGTDRTLVIRDGTLIDGSGRPPVANDALVIEGHRIKSVGRLAESLRSSGSRDDVQVIDASGQWIMPGLIDAHTHLSYGFPHLRGEGRGRGTMRPELGVLKAAWSAQKVLRSGVTSISVPGGTWFTDVGVRDAIKLGVLEGPRVHCAGRMIITYGSIEDDEPSWVGTPDHSVGVLCNSAAEMVTEVRRQCKHGVNFVKMADSRSGDLQTLARDEIAAVVDEAHRRGVRVAIHSRGGASTRAAAEAGVDWIIHCDLASEADLDVVARAGAAILPTMTFLATVVEASGRYGQEMIQMDVGESSAAPTPETTPSCPSASFTPRSWRSSSPTAASRRWRRSSPPPGATPSRWASRAIWGCSRRASWRTSSCSGAILSLTSARWPAAASWRASSRTARS